ncbi:MAG TPA: 3'(2'),5'-bisphosphate nucleotidase CysQ [Flavobacteriales bacterium]|jgi:3'(2'), 5'-bisphosphate nucleotidase|nr:3'(2'),5'-bisphosphate nucleotidase CysQ [Flavobacteriales bacterium]HQW30945.1 3'(2'),5'-bisphosphate nucleotidase CysQ [Flavobacteriales bacterium]HQY02657.1 3'(2'),5'-bisphosphate nucleotidase CysQ [Flavobacteriales bacterium]HQY79262.1 3'(2'),5'-bisphosphate nucleotidase CysQ [Flavobacteriales bacterium]HRA17091.1 3'(2'),5'-bisphosphate nucleotidase CysQ [Flavobacteriales bacterium]
MSELLPLMDRAIAAAFAAGREILDVYSRPINVELKDDRSPLTEADKRAHAAIAKELEKTGLPVLSEEGKHLPPAERQAWGMYWLVDPVDGTKEFIKRNGEFTVNIALMAKDAEPAGSLGSHRPVAGVLYVPVKDILYLAWKDGGSYRLEKATTFTGKTAYEAAASAMRLPMPHHREAFTIVASRSHASPDTDAYIQRMEKEHGKVATVSMGSALKICLVAEGAADAYPRYAPTMEWDTAAGHAIADEAGKSLVDISTGQPMRYNKYDLLNQWFIVQ